MKIISNIFVCFVLSVIVEGALLAAANRLIEPILISCGAAIFAAFKIDDEDDLDLSDFYSWKEWFEQKSGVKVAKEVPGHPNIFAT